MNRHINAVSLLSNSTPRAASGSNTQTTVQHTPISMELTQGNCLGGFCSHIGQSHKIRMENLISVYKLYLDQQKADQTKRSDYGSKKLQLHIP